MEGRYEVKVGGHCNGKREKEDCREGRRGKEKEAVVGGRASR